MLRKTISRYMFFLFLCFLGLYIGVILMNNGPRSNWYLSLNKAPWTPPNWMFGFAWSLIMLLFSGFMTKLSFKRNLFDQKLIILYSTQWLLNIFWNYVFFNQQKVAIGLIIISLLLILIGYFAISFKNELKIYSLLIIPYLVWMMVATSLNTYIVLNN